MMRTIAAAGGMTAASAIHINLFGPHPIVVHGTPEQKERWLPGLIAGRDKTCFGVTEPDAGLDTTRIATRAERAPGGYIVHGRQDPGRPPPSTRAKSCCSPGRRPAPIVPRRPTASACSTRRSIAPGSRFVASRRWAGTRSISNQLFIDGLFVPEDDRIGEEGRGFRYLLDSLNP